MVDQDVRRTRLVASRDPKWSARRLESLVGLPDAAAWLRMRTLADPSRMSGRERAAAMRFAVTDLADRARATFFAAMFPKMPKLVERAWQDMANAPLDRGYGRGFRAPGHVLATRAIRETWFEELVRELTGYEVDAAWLVEHGGAIGEGGLHASCRLLAAGVSLGGGAGASGSDVLEMLRAVIDGRGPAGAMGYHVVRGLLWSERPEAWKDAVDLLLRAQREEGLRQVILEEAHTAHPGAFARVLEAVDEHDLVRFSSTVRAVDVWLGLRWDSASTGVVQRTVKLTRRLLASREARLAAISGSDAEAAYIGLWCEAFGDAVGAMKRCEAMLAEGDATRRWLGARMLGMIGLPGAMPALLRALRDEDWAVVGAAVDSIGARPPWEYLLPEGEDEEGPEREADAWLDTDDADGRVEGLLGLIQRMPKGEVKFKPPVFAWGRSGLKASEVGRLLSGTCPSRLSHRLLDVVDRMDAITRWSMLADWRVDGWPGRKSDRALTPQVRSLMVRSLGDASPMVRKEAADRLAHEKLSDDEAAQHEALLERKTDDIRTRAVARLLTAKDEVVLAAAERLLGRGELCARAGAELLTEMVAANRSANAARALLARSSSAPSSGKGKVTGTPVQAAPRPVAQGSAADAFGLAVGLKERPVPVLAGKAASVEPASPAAFACLVSLDKWVDKHKMLELRAIESEQDRTKAEDGEADGGDDADAGDVTDNRSEMVVLGEEMGISQFEPGGGDEATEARKFEVIRELLEGWERQRGKDTRDADGLEAARAWLMLEASFDSGKSEVVATQRAVLGLVSKRLSHRMKYSSAVQLLVLWTLRRSRADVAGFFLDGLETSLRRGDVGRKSDNRFLSASRSAGEGLSVRGWLARMDDCPTLTDAVWTREHRRRREGLVRAAAAMVAMGKAEDPVAGALGPLRAGFDDVEAMWRAGQVSDAEMLVTLCTVEPGWETDYRPPAEHLREVLRRRLKARSSQTAAPRTAEEADLSQRLDGLAEKIRRRVLEIELARGDGVTVATPHAFSLEPAGGIDAAVGAMAALGDDHLHRSAGSVDRSRRAVMTHLVSESRPGPEDTPEAFAKAARAAGLSDRQLVELAVFQPRWAEHAERATGWDGLEEAVLWVRAHTKGRTLDNAWDQADEAWEAKVAELTPIPLASLGDGAVDRSWFERCHQKLGAKRWDAVYAAAKYASSGTGHARAQLFADAMLGGVTEKDLLQRVSAKRNQDAARALGLLPLPKGEARTQMLLRRYGALQEMLRTGKKAGGSAKQASEKRAVEIGLENLAWAAGYPDPLRLQWAMEIEQYGDLAEGPVTVTVDGVRVSLAVDEQGVPTLTASKPVKAGGPEKELKAVPPAVKKDKRVAVLAERLADLRRQTSRVRDGLEGAMCRGDEFSGAELAELFGHPLLRPMLSRLVLMGRTSAGGELIGYPDKSGKALRGLDGELEPVKGGDRLRIAHPLDLLAGKQWHQWQAECFRAERVQPFKQVFREVYVPAAPESRGKGVSTRYDGQQVRPSQALALFGRRGWVARPEEGVQRTFHREGVTVAVAFQEGFYTPAEVDGLTLAGLVFRKAGSEEPMEVAKVPARVFSEVMRDVDLVVSVAHRGGVDPEASFSTVEMRAALVRETCALLSLSNVRIESNRAMIKGTLGDYAVHLGSGMITRLPGGLVWVVPVHSQHRGRVFLPFADDDPTTAEVVSKVLLLARDAEIRDPAILAQLRG